MKHIFSTLRTLSDGEMQLIHDTSLRILSEIGIQTPNAEMLALLSEMGCKIDDQSQVAFYPRTLIESMIADCRRDAGPQNGEVVLRPITAGISTEVFLIDYMSRAKRLGTMDDIKKGIVLLDAMEHFPTADAVVVPSDVPAEASDLLTYRTLFGYSKKRAGTYILNPDMAPFIIEMAKLMGVKVGFLLDTVSPLKVRKESLDAAITFARQRMPIGFCSMVTSLGSAPVTPAGAMAVQNAEHLAGMVMLRALGQEAHGYPAVIHPCDPSTLICSFGAPSFGRTAVAGAQMARFYGLEPSGNIALTDALLPDFQCGFEKGLSVAMGGMAGLRGIGGQGIVGADQGNSFEQIVLDNEWIGAYNSAIRGVEVTEETIGYEAIARVGRSGTYLSDDHTMDHLRQEVWPSRLFLREPWDSAIGAGKPDLLARAHERVETLSAGYRNLPPVVSASKQDELNRITRAGLARAGFGDLRLPE